MEIGYIQNHFGFAPIAFDSNMTGCVRKHTLNIMSTIRTLQFPFRYRSAFFKR